MQVTPRRAAASRPSRPGGALTRAAFSCGPDRRRPPGYDRRVSERIADPQVVCPFVAFDDDRDFRSPVPDHRHRCFAESPAAPRALAHQAAYCLSSSFPGCPTFVDWARREAAPPKVEAPVLSPRDPAASPRPSRAAPKAAIPGAADRVADAGTGRPPEPAPRRSEAGWSAPPPWAAGMDRPSSPAAEPAGRAAEPPSEPLDAGAPVVDLAAEEAAAAAGPMAYPAEADATPAFLASRSRRPAPPDEDEEGEPWDAADEEPDDEAEDERYRRPGRRAVAEPRRVPVGYAPVGRSRGDGGGWAGSRSRREARQDPDAPTWEEPRRFEAYPTLKSSGSGGLPRPALYALIVVLVGVGLFAAPFLLKGLGGNGGEQATPTPASSASAGPSIAASPTAIPTPEQVIHVVKAGDSLSKIAATYGVTIDQILAANPKITNPNKIAVGDQIVIPQPLPTEIVELTPAP